MELVSASSSICSRFVSNWFNDQNTSDIEVLLKDNKTLYCHRVLLRSWSTVWDAALTDKKESLLDMTPHHAATVELCLKYCYNLEVELTDDNLTRVHFFAYQYNLDDLKSKCERKMTEGISLGNCMSLYSYLLKHSFPTLPNALESVTDIVCNEFVYAVESEGFLAIDEGTLCHLLTEPIRAHEDDVLDACDHWLGASPSPQTRERVLKLVRFPMLSAEKLVKLRKYSWFQQDLEARYEFANRWVLTGLITNADRRHELRAQLKEEEENKLGDQHLTPRGPRLRIKSAILDDAMNRTLVTMIGGGGNGILLLEGTDRTKVTEFDNAITYVKGPFLVLIEDMRHHVFGAYIEDEFVKDGEWIEGSPNNFLFSLNAIHPQKVVKLQRNLDSSQGIYTNLKAGLAMGGFEAFDEYKNEESLDYELAPGYESVGEKTLHGRFGEYFSDFIEVFALSVPKCPELVPSRKRKRRRD